MANDKTFQELIEQQLRSSPDAQARQASYAVAKDVIMSACHGNPSLDADAIVKVFSLVSDGIYLKMIKDLEPSSDKEATGAKTE